MDFIERIFGVSPDAGDGSLEFVYLVTAVAAVAVIAYMRYRRRMRKSMAK